MNMTNYTFDQLRSAVQECTSYDLINVFDDEHDEYILVDPFGDQDGDPFTDLDDVLDFITNNKQVEEYLDELTRPNGYAYIHT
jgi:hypothetical protein